MNGDGVLFIVLEVLVEELGEIDLSGLSQQEGREYLSSVFKKLDPLKIAHKLLTTNDEYEFFAAKKKEIVK